MVNGTVDDTLANLDANSTCDLREAITNANNDNTGYSDCGTGSGSDTILFDSGLGTTTITLASQLDNITDTDGLIIDGDNRITISGNNSVRLFWVDSGVPLTLQKITLANGSSSAGSGVYNNGGTLAVTNSAFSGNSASNSGGGIYNAGTLTITNSTISSNSASTGGAGISNHGTLTITNSTISGNVSPFGGLDNSSGTATISNSIFSGNIDPPGGFGGGIYNDNSTLTITDSTFSTNSAVNGGGIFNYTGTVSIANSTFSGNIATSNGGGVYNYMGTLTVTNSTFSGNTASSAGGGIYSWSGTALTLYNTILANSTSGGDCDFFSIAATGNNNLIEDASYACGLTNGVNGNIIGSDPNLGALTGSPAYFPLNSGSPAIDAGDDAVCAAAPVNNTSQNGVTRPNGAHCDIGSYELVQNFAPTDISLSDNSIDENQSAGTLVGNLSTTDPDLGDTFTYSFCGGADDASFTISGSALQSAAVFDYETKNSYSICIRSTDSGSLSTTKTFVISINNLVDTVSFTDVPASYWAYAYIERLYAAGITSGCATGLYCPDNYVTRAEMSVFLERGIHGSSFSPPNVAATFSDTAGHWAEDWIEALKSDGVTSGCGPGTYCPDAFTTRAEMAVFLLRSEHGASYIPPAATGSMFTDVPSTYWAAKWIEQLASEGITSGCAANLYCPDATVTRAQMAVFLVRTFNLP